MYLKFCIVQSTKGSGVWEKQVSGEDQKPGSFAQSYPGRVSGLDVPTLRPRPLSAPRRWRWR